VIRKVFQVSNLACLVGLSLLYPLIELLDRWDAPGPSSDSEIQIILLFTLVGLFFLLGHLPSFCAVFIFAAVLTDFCFGAGRATYALAFSLQTSITASPPLPLRI